MWNGLDYSLYIYFDKSNVMKLKIKTEYKSYLYISFSLSRSSQKIIFMFSL